MEIDSLNIPPIEKTKILYIITIVEVTKMLFLKSWGLPKEINTVFTPRAIIIRRDIQPCQDSAPTPTMVTVSMTTEI